MSHVSSKPLFAQTILPREMIEQLNALKPRYEEQKNGYPDAIPQEGEMPRGEVLYRKVVFGIMPTPLFRNLEYLLQKTYGQRPEHQHNIHEGNKDTVSNVMIAGDLPLRDLQIAGLKIEGLPEHNRGAAR